LEMAGALSDAKRRSGGVEAEGASDTTNRSPAVARVTAAPVTMADRGTRARNEWSSTDTTADESTSVRRCASFAQTGRTPLSNVTPGGSRKVPGFRGAGVGGDSVVVPSRVAEVPLPALHGLRSRPIGVSPNRCMLAFEFVVDSGCR